MDDSNIYHVKLKKSFNDAAVEAINKGENPCLFDAVDRDQILPSDMICECPKCFPRH